MASLSGLLIAIEGSTSLRDTQTDLLAERLASDGYDVVIFDFPQIDQSSSYFVRQYLAGEYGDPKQVTPYTCSLFYALDRHEAAPDIRKALEAGKVVICNSYVGSNMANQGIKFTNEAERRGFFIWVDSLEYNLLGIPRPQANIVLRSGEVTDVSYMFDSLCSLFPQDFVPISTVGNDGQLPSSEIGGVVRNWLQPLLQNAQRRNTTGSVSYGVSAPQNSNMPSIKNEEGRYKYYVPATLKGATRKTYTTSTNQIFELYDQMLEKLIEHLKRESNIPKSERTPSWAEQISAQAAAILQAVLPVSATSGDGFYVPLSDGTSSVRELADSLLPQSYGIPGEQLVLVDMWPRRELDLAADMLYEHSNASLKDIRNFTTDAQYAELYDIVRAYLKQQTKALQKAHYQWDIVTEYRVFSDLRLRSKTESLQWQALTPRMGYDVPAEVEEAGLTEDFEHCFDISMELYSKLQEAGNEVEAQYAVLHGHNIRFSVTLNAHEISELRKTQSGASLEGLARLLHEKVSEVHPIIGEAMSS